MSVKLGAQKNQHVSILPFYRNKFNKFNNFVAQLLDSICYMTLKLLQLCLHLKQTSDLACKRRVKHRV